MSNRELRSRERIDYAIFNETGEKNPFNQARECPRESDGSSEESLSGSDNSQDRTLVLNEVESEGFSILSGELKRLSVSSPTESHHPPVSSTTVPQPEAGGPFTEVQLDSLASFSVSSPIEPKPSVVGSLSEVQLDSLASCSVSSPTEPKPPVVGSLSEVHLDSLASYSVSSPFESSYHSVASSSDLQQLAVRRSSTKSYHSLFTESHISLVGAMAANTGLQKLIATQEALHDDLYDFMDEESVHDLQNVEDINLYVAKLEGMRSKYRSIHKEICRLVEDEEEIGKLKEPFDEMLNSVKKELAEAKRMKNEIRARELDNEAHDRYNKNVKEQEERDKRENSITFLFIEVDRLLSGIIKEIDLNNVSDDRNVLSDDDLLEMKKQLPGIQKRIENFSAKYSELLKLVPDQVGSRKSHLDNLANDFKLMLNNHAKYQTHLQREVTARQIDKERKFQTSSLKINIPKFKGYDSALDFYSFKSKFEQLHLQDIPDRALPEFLKNNYLDGPALESVKRLETMNEIWYNLKKAFGDPRVMMMKKLSELDSLGHLYKVREAEKIKEGLNKVVNIMQDLVKLAADHHIEEKLYYGDSIYSIYRILGDARVTKFIEKNCEVELQGAQLWRELEKFLDKEIKVQLEKSMIYRTFPDKSSQSSKGEGKDKLISKTHLTNDWNKNNTEPNNDVALHSMSSGGTDPVPKVVNPNVKSCHLCGRDDHIATKGPYGKKFVQYFSCKEFVDSTCSQRFALLKRKGFCTQCLFPGAHATAGKHVDGTCQSIYVCKHDSHKTFTVKKHVLVCDDHKEDESNKALLEEYRARCITRKCNQELPEYSKTIQLSHFCALPAFTTTSPGEEDNGDGIYMFQSIMVNHQKYTLFLDSGCAKSVFTKDAVDRLGGNAKQIFDGTIELGGVGGFKMESPHGEYQISLPLANGKNAVLTGLVIDQITNKFPMYTLNGEVESHIQGEFEKLSGDPKKELPRLFPSVGGRVDIMIGVQYMKYYPKEVFRTDSGLAIYSSPFKSADGSRGVVAGPHPSFRMANRNFFTGTRRTAFFTAQMDLIRNMDEFPPKSYHDQVMHETEEEEIHNYICCTCSLVSRNKNMFDVVENAGSEISYRCVRCRECHDCKSGERIESISLQEEVQNDIIIKTVKVDLASKKTTATLPFMLNPITHLQPNRDQALLVYKTQVRKLSKDPEAKAEVLAAQNQLQELGFVQYVKNLTDAQRQTLFSSALKYFIPWRVVWNLNSVTTVCRPVFDASMPTKSGLALNDVLAKGRNQMNKIVEIVLRWFTRKVGFHSDAKKMYNSVRLAESHWCYQMYLWQDDLDLEKEPEEKVIMTLIYGVKPSGNQAEHGLRETARAQKDKYPRAYEVVINDIYVDDCVSGEEDIGSAEQTVSDIDTMIQNGGFKLKGATYSGRPPPQHLSRDGISVNVFGFKWYSEEDAVQLDVGEINFATKQRGKKVSTDETRRIPLNLTRKHCQGKVSEIFDISGKVAPLTGGMKIDLREFVDRGIAWKETIPDELRPVWTSHFEMIQEIPNLRYRRTIIPDDAESLNIETIDTGDASKVLACVAIYARIKRRCGEYSCQLVFARTKLLERGITQPRAELMAAMLNSHTGEVVRRAFGNLHTGAIKLSDSQIVLHWINNDQKSLKQYARARVIETIRFSRRDQWFYIRSGDLIADLGTRKGVKIKDVDKDSDWINGYEWMRKERSSFPIKPIEELVLTKSEKESYQKELFAPYHQEDSDFKWHQTDGCESGTSFFINNRFSHTDISARYQFSNYVIDPNKNYFSLVVRLLAWVFRFIHNTRTRIGMEKGSCSASDLLGQNQTLDSLLLSDDEIKNASRYYFLKATNEVFHFAKKGDYENISTLKDGLLQYTGRILPTQGIESAVTLSDAMKDLSATSFVVPIVDAHSPVAYSIVNEIHWSHEVAQHRGIETVYRYVLQVCYVLNGRNLVKMFRKNCERCRYLAKRTIEIEMGPVSGQNLMIAPAFYITQVDIAGSFLSYSPYNKRTTVKIYLAVFCCSTTSSVIIKVMEDYSASSFIQSFIRFSCETGYPKILVSDEGSQLLKGYEDMRINYSDLRNKLHREVGVEFDVVPAGGHNMTGRVERKIQEVKKSIERSYDKQRLSIIQWETVASEIANAINDLPLALGNLVSDFEEMDLITPNRLRMGRNNNRSPVGPLFVVNDPSKFFAENTKIFNAWFETWLTSHVPKLMKQPKWFRTEYDIKVGDVVLFLKKEGLLNSTYQYGMVKSVEVSKDDKIRTVILKYRNHHEAVDRETRRAVRQLVVIHKVDELDIVQELGKIATAVDMKKRLNCCSG